MGLKKILKGVSRSFYLSIVLLPRRIREPIGLAFLACKAADTIADTELIPTAERMKTLDAYREMFAPGARHQAKKSGGSGAEAALLEAIPELTESLFELDSSDRLLIQELVLELTQGMQADLQMTRPLANESELEQYIYYVAGCVGRFWTRMVRQHFEFAKHWGGKEEELGEKIGKGLQLVNILRDLPRDLQKGRCYIPQELLSRYRLTAGDLLHPDNMEKVRPVLLELAARARKYLNSYLPYCALYPRHALRLKAVVRLPARLGFKTLELLENSTQWLNPDARLKISRRQVYQNLLASFFQ